MTSSRLDVTLDLDIGNMLLKDNGPQSIHGPDHTADYWISILRSNLQIAHSNRTDDLDTDDEQPSINEEILKAPRRKSARASLAAAIAARLYPSSDPDSLAPIIKYEKDIVLLRNLILEQRRTAITRATEHNARHNWIKRIARQGPWNEADDPLPVDGAPSLPMPVEVSDKASLAPFFAHLRNNGTHQPSSSANSDDFTTGIEPFYDVDLIEFQKGVLYADGRIDLCKMVTGPRNIGDLMDSLRTSTFSRHFLLGNNIIGSTGAKAIASFIEVFPDRFETWYLAGNCIDSASFGLLVDSMTKSEAITNVWLKRNPLGRAAAPHVFRLVTQTPNLRTLDLDQTELGDAGVAELFYLLTKHDAPIALRHIYLNATGIGKDACAQIAHYLRSSCCSVRSIYMSNNPIGGNVAALAEGLSVNTSLQRLSIQSCGLAEVGCLFDALKSHKTLEMLDIGQSYATEDLGMRFNWLSNSSAPSIVSFVESSPSLRYLSLSYVPLEQPALNSILSAVSISSTLLWFEAKPLNKGGRDSASVHAGQEAGRLNKLVRERLHANVQAKYDGMSYQQFDAEHKRFLVSPKDVRYIDSVYRNRDAGAARRGLKVLDKWWKEGDVTLQQLRDGILS